MDSGVAPAVTAVSTTAAATPVPERLVALLSSGIDSPVAAYLMLKQGFSIIALHFDNRPYSDERGVDKFQRLVDRLETFTGRAISRVIAPHGHPTQAAIARNCDRHVQCILCKRMMLRVAEQIAHTEWASALVTGDNLGQVASQTLVNIRTISEAVKIPILRPLIAFDKSDTIELAKTIGTYELSIMPDPGCTAVPAKPATSARLARILKEESKLDISALLQEVAGAVVFEREDRGRALSSIPI